MPAADLPTRIWRIGLVLLAVAFGMALGAFLSGGLSEAEEAGAATPIGPDVGDIRVAADTAGPSDKINGVGIGFTHSEDGALAAATNLVLTLEQAVTTDRSSAVQAYETLAAEASQETLARDMGAVWDALNNGVATNGPLNSSLFLRTVPIGHELTRYADDRATVEIWTLTVLAADGMVEPLATYETATVELVWESDDWKVWATSSTTGPVPAWTDPATTTDSFLTSIELLEGYRYAVS
jgi:hypothetical protein